MKSNKRLFIEKWMGETWAAQAEKELLVAIEKDGKPQMVEEFKEYIKKEIDTMWRYAENADNRESRLYYEGRSDALENIISVYETIFTTANTPKTMKIYREMEGPEFGSNKFGHEIKSKKPIPPGIISFKSHTGTEDVLVYREEEWDYEIWVRNWLSQQPLGPAPIHTIVVDDVEWILGEVFVYGGKIESFEWNGEEWFAVATNGIKPRVKAMKKPKGLNSSSGWDEIENANRYIPTTNSRGKPVVKIGKIYLYPGDLYYWVEPGWNINSHEVYESMEAVGRFARKEDAEKWVEENKPKELDYKSGLYSIIRAYNCYIEYLLEELIELRNNGAYETHPMSYYEEFQRVFRDALSEALAPFINNVKP